MLNKSFLRIVCIISVLTGNVWALSAGVYGAIIGASTKGHLCDSETCKESARIGLGGFYMPTKELDSQSYGGYLAIDGALNFGTQRRFLFGIEANLGGGRAESKNTTYTFAPDNRTAIIMEIRPKFGFNFTSQNAPLFLSIVYTADLHQTTNTKDTKGYNRMLNQVGVELEGALPTQSGFTIEYALGYDYLFAGNYKFGEVSGNSTINNGYTLRASLGFSHKLTENTLYYLRVIGKYYNLSPSKPLDSNGVNLSMPATQNYTGMVEFGIGF